MNLKSKINQILIDWDPIGIKEQTNIENEYSRYIDEIIEVMDNKRKLKDLIYEIEGIRIGFFYTTEKEKEHVIESIFKLNSLKNGL